MCYTFEKARSAGVLADGPIDGSCLGLFGPVACSVVTGSLWPLTHKLLAGMGSPTVAD